MQRFTLDVSLAFSVSCDFNSMSYEAIADSLRVGIPASLGSSAALSALSRCFEDDASTALSLCFKGDEYATLSLLFCVKASAAYGVRFHEIDVKCFGCPAAVERRKVDLSKLKRHRGAKDAQELEEVVSGYKKHMEDLRRQINQMTPNMRVRGEKGYTIV